MHVRQVLRSIVCRLPRLVLVLGIILPGVALPGL